MKVIAQGSHPYKKAWSDGVVLGASLMIKSTPDREEEEHKFQLVMITYVSLVGVRSYLCEVVCGSSLCFRKEVSSL